MARQAVSLHDLSSATLAELTQPGIYKTLRCLHSLAQEDISLVAKGQFSFGHWIYTVQTLDVTLNNAKVADMCRANGLSSADAGNIGRYLKFYRLIEPIHAEKYLYLCELKKHALRAFMTNNILKDAFNWLSDEHPELYKYITSYQAFE